ncbi:MAG: DUF1887 family protein [Rubrivivax sp.]|nr:DUF1887 family protein [Rubrivivax sp.]
MSTATQPAVHVCIATGQNAANFIPLQQYDAREVWILQTPSMKSSADQLALALRQEGRVVRRKPFDDSSPSALARSAESVAEQLDGRHVVLHATGGTKLMVLALRDGLRLVEAGEGRLDIVYADTLRQQIDWLGEAPRTELMADVLDLQKMLLVQGYRIDGDSRHRAAVARASDPSRARMTRRLGEGAGRVGAFLSALATMASRAADERALESDLLQRLDYPPGGAAAKLLREAADAGLLNWDGEVTLQFADRDRAAYFAGGWIEEFVLLKLSGIVKPDRFASNLQVVSAAHGVPNELDAMVVHRNRALVIECKTGRQAQPSAALYKLAQLRDRLGGSVAAALYVSAQRLSDEHRRRAEEYRVSVLCGDEVARLPAWVREWMTG